MQAYVSGNSACDGKISCSLDENIQTLSEIYRRDISKDLIVREFMLCGKLRACVFSINGLSDSNMINDYILRDGTHSSCPDVASDIIEYAKTNIFTINDLKSASELKDVKKAITDGLAAILVDGCDTCLLADTRSYPERSISTSENEKGVYGPKEAFIENIRANISLIRRHTHTEDLVCEMNTCGEQSRTAVALLYRDEIVSPELLSEVKRALASVKIDSALSTGMITQMFCNKKYSPVPQVLLTEKPDRCAACLMSGHIVLLCDGCPTGAILPITLMSLLSAAEDSYANALTGFFIRAIRLTGAAISIAVPGIFIAIVMHHQGFLSSEILNTIIASRKMVFVPIGAEMLLLLLVFQLVREAGMRVPGSIGQAIGIIGGLVLGQAVVAANLASSVVLILVALTGLGSFCIPDYTTQISSVYFRIVFVIAGWVGGFLGLFSAFLLFFAYLAKLQTFGKQFI